MTVTVSLLFFASMNGPLPALTVNGGSRVPTIPCKGNLPLFSILRFLLFEEPTFTLPKLRLPETLSVPGDEVAVGVAVGVSVPVAVAVAVEVAVAVGVGDAATVGVAVAVAGVAEVVVVAVGLIDAVAVEVAVTLGVADEVGVEVAVGVAVAVGGAVAVGVAVAVAVVRTRASAIQVSQFGVGSLVGPAYSAATQTAV